MSSKKIVLDVNEWDPNAIIYGAPKVSDKGAKSIMVTSKQTNRMLHITTPLMMTFGISDYVDATTGQGDGRYSISLIFPNDEYRTEMTDTFLEKLKAFENQILDDAVKNSEKWFGKKMTREICEYSYFPLLKYSKNKETKETDYNRPPTLRAKVPNYGGKWSVEIYDTSSRLIFPCENENITPIELVPKLSQVATGLQCTGIWLTSKAWGLTFKMFQCVVKRREVVSAFGKCHITLSNDEKNVMEKQVIPDDAAIAVVEAKMSEKTAAEPVSTFAEDSEDEAEPPVTPAIVEAAVAETAAQDPPVAPLFKKVVKKAPAAAEEAAPPAAPAEEEAAAAPVKKTVVKKVVKKATA
jgi:hypothetical protein